MSSSFKENLRNELDFQGIIVKELSARTKIPVATLDCYLRTLSVEPSAENAVKIARALKVSVEYLVYGDDKDSEETQRVLNREAREIMRRVESLSAGQCRAILRLVKSFEGYSPP
jgi:transcriptional regulator with XRE-family HTH domain